MTDRQTFEIIYRASSWPEPQYQDIAGPVKERFMDSWFWCLTPGFGILVIIWDQGFLAYSHFPSLGHEKSLPSMLETWFFFKPHVFGYGKSFGTISRVRPTRTKSEQARPTRTKSEQARPAQSKPEQVRWVWEIIWDHFQNPQIDLKIKNIIYKL